MADEEVSHDGLPNDGRFKKGQSGNPLGRPKKIAMPLAEAINRALQSPTTFREGSTTQTAPALDVVLRATIRRAAEGNVSAAQSVLAARREALKHAGSRVERIVVHNRLPRVGRDSDDPEQ